jgi:hypothetical protein
MPNLDDLIVDLSQGLQPVRPISPMGGQILVGVLALSTLIATGAWWGMRDDVLAATPAPITALSIGLFFLLAVAGGWSLTRMAQPRVGMSNNGWRWAVAAVAVLPSIALFLAIQSPVDRVFMTWEGGIGCLLRGLGASLLVAVGLTFWLRRGAPMRINVSAWLIGLVAGAVGAIAVALTCPDDALTHIGIWHAAVVGATAVVGRLSLPRLLRW